jgi:preprotein translocase subunit SecA
LPEGLLVVFKFLTRFFGSRNQRLLRLYQRLVDAANAFEPKMLELKDEDFPALTVAFRERLAAGETTDDLLPEAFAAVR